MKENREIEALVQGLVEGSIRAVLLEQGITFCSLCGKQIPVTEDNTAMLGPLPISVCDDHEDDDPRPFDPDDIPHNDRFDS